MKNLQEISRNLVELSAASYGKNPLELILLIVPEWQPFWISIVRCYLFLLTFTQWHLYISCGPCAPCAMEVSPIQKCGLSLDVSVSRCTKCLISVWSQQKLSTSWSHLGLIRLMSLISHLHLLPKTNLRPNCAHQNN